MYAQASVSIYVKACALSSVNVPLRIDNKRPCIIKSKGSEIYVYAYYSNAFIHTVEEEERFEHSNIPSV